MTYDRVAEFSAFWGMMFFIVLFLAVLAYTFWPASKRRFDDAAKIPFKEKE